MVSTYFFFYQLSPKELCQNFFCQFKVDSIDIAIYRNNIWIKWFEDKRPIDEIAPIVRMLVDALVSGYSFFAKPAIMLDMQPTQWLEFKDIRIDQNYIAGYMDQLIPIVGRPDSTHKDNEVLKTIVAIFPLILNTSALRFSLNDYHMARRSRLEDAYVYLYRAIESIRIHFDEGSKSPQWDRMHNALGTSESQIQPLTDEAKSGRHGDFKSLSPDSAKLNTCMKITEDIIDAFLYHISDGKVGKALNKQ